MEDINKDIANFNVVQKVILKKLNSIKNKKLTENGFEELSIAFRVFLMRYLDLSYEFTEEELSKELSRKRLKKIIKENVTEIAILLDEVKYSDRKITNEEFMSIIDKFQQIIEESSSKQNKKIENEQNHNGLGAIQSFINKLNCIFRRN